MAINRYPFTDFSSYNLDWIILKIKEFEKSLTDYEALHSITFGGDWDISKSYTQWTIVSDPVTNDGYLSLQPVPYNVQITNTDYWLKIADYTTGLAAVNARMDAVEADITDNIKPDIDAIEADITDNIKPNILTLNNDISVVSDKVDDIPILDTEMMIEPEYIGDIGISTSKIAQGMTTDGVYLYIAAVDMSDGLSNPIMKRCLPNDLLNGTIKNLPQDGHYNNLNYDSGYIYATGVSNLYNDYSKIYKYYWPSNSGTLIPTSTGQEYWNFAIGKLKYGQKYYIGSLGGRNAFNLYSEVVPGSGKYYPFTKCKTPYFNGVWQGCTILNIDNSQFIATVIANRRDFTPAVDSHDEILITTLSGDIAKHICLNLGVYENEELEDCCQLGNDLYILTATGKMFRINNINNCLIGFYEQYIPTLFQESRFLYINENGSEDWYSTTHSGPTMKLLKSFSLNPFTQLEMFGNCIGMFVIDNRAFPIMCNPTAGDLRISVNWTDRVYSNELAFSYARGSSPTSYTYTLDESSIKASFRNGDGIITRCDNIADLLQNFIYDSNAYVYFLTSSPSAKYTYTPDEF